MAKTMTSTRARTAGRTGATAPSRTGRAATSRTSSSRATASTRAGARTASATASRRPAPRTIDDDVTFRTPRGARSGVSATTSARRPVTSGFDRFAGNVPTFDYWSGSEAPDFEYWDNLSQHSPEDWSDFAVQESAAPARETRTAPSRSSRAGSRAAAKPAAPVSAAEAFANLYDSAAVATNEMQMRARQLPSSTILAFCAAMLVVCFAVLAFVRIDWNSEAVQVKLDSQEISETITSARAAGRVLEVQKSVASAAQRIRTEAIFLGMVEPEHIESLVLPPDTLTVDKDGHLSLSGSLARVAEKAPAR